MDSRRKKCEKQRFPDNVNLFAITEKACGEGGICFFALLFLLVLVTRAL